MKIIKSRHLTLTNNNPKICVPLTGKNFSEIAAQAKAVAGMHPDLAEWRADFLEEIIKEPSAGSFLRLAKPILEELKKILPDTPLIFTLRTKEEGGMVSFSEDAYREICIAAAKTAGDYPIDFIDVEAVRIADAKSFIKEIHDAGCLVIGSNHHFSKTPPQSGMVEILRQIEKTGADIAKLAVMPLEKEDVTALMEASKEADACLKIPLITMSMSELGAITRVCTKQTGSVITFASGIEASAPGQESIEVVRSLLSFHRNCALQGNIALIGFMGTGKTTVSKALSRITGFEEVDVDQCIVSNEGMTINDIFAEKGEQGFRDIETETLQNLTKKEGQIISCGGGAVLRDENVRILKQAGTIVLLTATPETIFERVKDHTHRPILNQDMSLSHVKKLMAGREPRYQEVADLKVSVDSNDRVKTCLEILRKLQEMGKITLLA